MKPMALWMLFCCITTFFAPFFSCSLTAQTLPRRQYTIEDGLPHSNVFRAFQDSRGFIWFGTEYGVCRFDGKTFEQFEQYKPIQGKQILGIVETPDGVIWINTYDGRLHQYRNGAFQEYFPHSGDIPPKITVMVVDPDSRIWMISYARLYVLERDTVRHINIGIPLSADSKVGTRTHGVTIDTGGNPLVLSSDGVYTITGNTSQLAFGDVLDSSRVYCAYQDKSNSLWFGMDDKVVRIAANGAVAEYKSIGLAGRQVWVIRNDRHDNLWLIPTGTALARIAPGGAVEDITTTTGTDNIIVNDILIDREGNAWLATFGSGVFCMLNQPAVNYTVKDGLTNNYVHVFAERQNGEVWMGSVDGVNIYHRDSLYPYAVNAVLGKPDDAYVRVEGMCADSAGNVLFCVQTSEFITVGEKTYSRNFYPESAWEYYVDPDGTVLVWIGLGLHELRSGELVVWDSAAHLKARNIYAIQRMRDGALWIATDSGLARRTKDTMTWFTKQQDLPGNVVRDICESNNGDIWAATDNGVGRYADGIWTTYTDSDGLSHRYCTSVRADRFGAVWVGTMNGLNRIGPAGIMTMQRKNGLITDEIRTLFLDSRNQLWVGTVNGVTKIMTSAALTAPATAPEVYIAGVVTPHARQFDAKTITLEYDQADIAIDFASIVYTFPEGVEFEYKLLPDDTEWRYTKERRQSYQRLPAGKYRFLVRAKIDDGSWSPAPAELAITILPPIWQTWQFRTLAALLALTGVYSLARYRANIVKRRALEALNNRNKILQLEQQALNSSVNPHFLFNALNSIQYFFNERKNSFHANIYLSKFAKLIRQLLNDAQKETNALDEEVARLELYLELEKMRLEDKFSYSITVADDIESDVIAIPVMIVQPYVENAIWHGITPLEESGAVRVEFSMRDEHTLQIVIIDDGIGMENSAALRARQKVQRESRGMAMTRERLELYARSIESEYALTINPVDPANTRRPGTRVEIALTV